MVSEMRFSSFFPKFCETADVLFSPNLEINRFIGLKECRFQFLIQVGQNKDMRLDEKG